MSSKLEFFKKVAEVQRNIKAPKSQYNKFGKYNYRSCEDVFEGAKAVLGDLVLFVTDSVEVHGDRIYIKATATITDGENEIRNSALAREALTKKGMDESQITGTASSYARKYALNGLLCIDDTKDADHDSNNSKAQPVTIETKPAVINQDQAAAIKTLFHAGMTEQQFLTAWNMQKVEDLQLQNYDAASNWLIQSKVSK